MESTPTLMWPCSWEPQSKCEKTLNTHRRVALRHQHTSKGFYFIFFKKEDDILSVTSRWLYVYKTSITVALKGFDK